MSNDAAQTAPATRYRIVMCRREPGATAAFYGGSYATREAAVAVMQRCESKHSAVCHYQVVPTIKGKRI